MHERVAVEEHRQGGAHEAQPALFFNHTCLQTRSVDATLETQGRVASVLSSWYKAGGLVFHCLSSGTIVRRALTSREATGQGRDLVAMCACVHQQLWYVGHLNRAKLKARVPQHSACSYCSSQKTKLFCTKSRMGFARSSANVASLA